MTLGPIRTRARDLNILQLVISILLPKSDDRFTTLPLVLEVLLLFSLIYTWKPNLQSRCLLRK
jgi:hypothetical protein